MNELMDKLLSEKSLMLLLNYCLDEKWNEYLR